MAPSRSAAPGISRRCFLAVSAAGLAALTTACTGEPAEEQEPVTAAQAVGFSDQVAVQAALVAAYTAAGNADPALATAVSEQAAQAGEQLERLRAAAPGAPASSAPPTGETAVDEARAWLRDRVSETAASHTAACLEQTGARAALLGSIAAGLRGQQAALA